MRSIGRFGGKRGQYPSFEALLNGLYQHVLRHPQNPEAAWQEAVNTKRNKEQCFDMLIKWLRANEPATQAEIFRALDTDPTTPGALQGAPCEVLAP